MQIVSVQDAGKGWTTVRYADGRVEKRSGMRGWRNNNPGNIEFGPFARSQGAVGTDGRFAVFPTYESGRNAKAALVFDSKGYRNKSIKQAIARYAPAFENDTASYARRVANAIGVSVDTKVSSLTPAQRSVMLDAMQSVEGYRSGKVTVIKPGSGNYRVNSLVESIQGQTVISPQRTIDDSPVTSRATNRGTVAIPTSRYAAPNALRVNYTDATDPRGAMQMQGYVPAGTYSDRIAQAFDVDPTAIDGVARSTGEIAVPSGRPTALASIDGAETTGQIAIPSSRPGTQVASAPAQVANDAVYIPEGYANQDRFNVDSIVANNIAQRQTRNDAYQGIVDRMTASGSANPYSSSTSNRSLNTIVRGHQQREAATSIPQGGVSLTRDFGPNQGINMSPAGNQTNSVTNNTGLPNNRVAAGEIAYQNPSLARQSTNQSVASQAAVDAHYSRNTPTNTTQAVPGTTSTTSRSQISIPAGSTNTSAPTSSYTANQSVGTQAAAQAANQNAIQKAFRTMQNIEAAANVSQINNSDINNANQQGTQSTQSPSITRQPSSQNQSTQQTTAPVTTERGQQQNQESAQTAPVTRQQTVTRPQVNIPTTTAPSSQSGSNSISRAISGLMQSVTRGSRGPASLDSSRSVQRGYTTPGGQSVVASYGNDGSRSTYSVTSDGRVVVTTQRSNLGDQGSTVSYAGTSSAGRRANTGNYAKSRTSQNSGSGVRGQGSGNKRSGGSGGGGGGGGNKYICTTMRDFGYLPDHILMMDEIVGYYSAPSWLTDWYKSWGEPWANYCRKNKVARMATAPAAMAWAYTMAGLFKMSMKKVKPNV